MRRVFFYPNRLTSNNLISNGFLLYSYKCNHTLDTMASCLTNKQRRFVEEYCVDSNATQAAIRAGYSEKTARSIGHENLTKPDIEEAIEKRMDQLSMKSAEVLKKLTEWGRGSLEHFITSDDYSAALDVNSEQARQNLGLIKKIKQRERVLKSEGDQDETVLSRTFEIEIHDPKDAVIQIGKIRGMYTDKIEISGSLDIKGVNFD